MIYFEILIQWFPVSSLLCICRRYILAKSWFFSPRQQRKPEDLRLYVLHSPNWLAYWLNVTIAVFRFFWQTRVFRPLRVSDYSLGCIVALNCNKWCSHFSFIGATPYINVFFSFCFTTNQLLIIRALSGNLFRTCFIF